MIMEPMPYMLTLHYMVLAMRDIKFPITKAELLEKVGDKMIRPRGLHPLPRHHQ